MQKNVASQTIDFLMLSTTDGSGVTSGTPVVYYKGDGGTQTTGTGTASHKGNGEWEYTPVQAETNFNHIAFTMVLSGAFSQLVNVYTTHPQTGDAYTAVTSLNNLSAAEVNAEVDSALADYDPPTKAELDSGFALLNDFDPANDTVAHVTLVDTTTVNTDMRGTDNAALASVCTEVRLSELDAINLPANIDSILTDTGTTIPGLINALNNFDPVNDTVAHVTLVDTTTVNTDMRGTDNAALASICTDVRLSELDAVNLPTDIDNILTDTSTTIPGLISALNNFDPTTTTVNVGKILGSSLTETSAGYLAAAISYFYDVITPAKTINDCGVAGSGLSAEDVWTYTTRELTGGSGDATAANQTTIIDHLTAIKGSGFSTTTDSLEAIRDQGDAAWITGAGGSAPTVQEIRTEIDSNSTQLAAIVQYTGTTIPAQISGLNNISTAEVKAEVDTALADYGANTITPPTVGEIRAEIDSSSTQLAAIVTDTGTTIPAQISGLNNISAAEVNAEVDTALADYGANTTTPPTVGEIRAEIDSSSTQLAAIVQDTNELQTNQGNWATADLTSITADITAILQDTGTTLPAQISALENISVADIIAGVTDGTYDLTELMTIFSAVLAGKSSGGGTSTIVFRDTADSVNAVTATVDANNNRTSISIGV